MSVLDPGKTLRNLKKKSFQESTVRSGDHIYLEYFYEKKLVTYTKISHHSSDIGPHLIKQMSYQCKLSKDQFLDLAKCPMGQGEYEEILKRNGILSQ
ncbi:MAG TPA: hypothetical protein PLW31_08655 [Bacteroidales bacterium]|nr:hypothetical protein [Bacteroidales bacterium]HPI85120.1 hypothetical protein [Bacteroidales bacterium]